MAIPLVNVWKPSTPDNGLTLKFVDFSVDIKRKHGVATVVLVYEEVNNKDYRREIVGPINRVYPAALKALPQNQVLRFTKFFDEKRLDLEFGRREKIVKEMIKQKEKEFEQKLTSKEKNEIDSVFQKKDLKHSDLEDLVAKYGVTTYIKKLLGDIPDTHPIHKERILKLKNPEQYWNNKKKKPTSTAQSISRWYDEKDEPKNKVASNIYKEVFDKYLLELQLEQKEEIKEKAIQKKDLGIYGYKTAGEMLAERLAETGITTKELADAAEFADTSMIQKQIKGLRDITRDQAIIYAKVFGCTPSDILFPAPQIPIWGSLDFLRYANHTFAAHEPPTVTLPWSPGEIYPDAKLPSVLVPSSIYRPDIKAIQVRSKGSSLDGNVLFYYASNNIEQDCLNRLCFVGIAETALDASSENRYYVGIYENYRGKIRVINPDPFGKEALDKDASNPRNKHNKNKPDNNLVLNEYWTDDIEFATPIVAIINPEKIKHDKYSAELFKKNTAIFDAVRKQEQARILNAERKFKEAQMLKEKSKGISEKIQQDVESLNKRIEHIHSQLDKQKGIDEIIRPRLVKDLQEKVSMRASMERLRDKIA